MNELRTGLVEAMVKAHYEMERQHVNNKWPPYEELGTFGQRTYFEFMSRAVDEGLGFLFNEADKWTNAYWEHFNPVGDERVRTKSTITGLIAALRESE